MHPFLQRIIMGKQLKHEDGYLKLMGNPGMIYSLNSYVVMQEMMDKELGAKGKSLMYYFLAYQAANAAKEMKNRFGFSNEKTLQLMEGHLDMIGAGQLRFKRLDFKKANFIFSGMSTFAKEYTQTFGIQKEPVDWMIKGGLAWLINECLGRDDMVCIETKCIAKGNKECEFVVKPKKEFSAAELKGQLPEKISFDLHKVLKKFNLGVPQR